LRRAIVMAGRNITGQSVGLYFGGVRLTGFYLVVDFQADFVFSV